MNARLRSYYYGPPTSRGGKLGINIAHVKSRAHLNDRPGLNKSDDSRGFYNANPRRA